MSIDASLLEDLADTIATKADNVLINDSITIAAFDLEQVVANLFEVKFTVTSAQTSLITNIKLRRADNSTLSNNDVSIPVGDESIIRQTITVTEVTS